MESKEPAIVVKNIKKGFIVNEEEIPVLKGINLKIEEGDFAVIIGPSGSGKSTLLNTILGLEKPDEGEVLVQSKNIYDIEDRKRASFRRKKFGAVYQQSSWIKSLNVMENVLFPLGIAGISKKEGLEKAKEVLYLFNFDKYKKYSPTELSGGQQQRLSVCRALISNPPIILADEPTGSLDSTTSDDLMYSLKILNVEFGKTMLMVTHNPDFERYATKVIYMDSGKIKRIKEKGRPQPNKEIQNAAKVQIPDGSIWMKYKYIIGIALKNIRKYKIRNMLTSGGVALSIGFIIFLAALSYGFQKLSTEGIESMEDFQVLDVETGKSKLDHISEASVEEMEDIFGVEKVLPLVSVAGDFSANGKSIEGVVYGRGSDILKLEKPRVVTGSSYSSEEAEETLINTVAFQELFTSDQKKALGSDVDVDMILRPELLGGEEKDFKKVSKKYKIVGVINEGDAPYIYIPLDSFKRLGVVNYSEAKVKTTTQENVDKIKALIERMGYKVSSIGDTIQQANQFFSIFRVILVIFGIIAIAVSCIGMFNTLTISLIEKTREIGIMKSMGATINDVKRVYILESFFIGIIGGVAGIIISYLLGAFFNASIYALARSTGNDPVEIFIFTPGLILFAIILSVLISVLTGLYPSRRASNISALDALRYE